MNAASEAACFCFCCSCVWFLSSSSAVPPARSRSLPSPRVVREATVFWHGCRWSSPKVQMCLTLLCWLRAAADDATLKGFSPACSLAILRAATVLAGFVALISCFPPAIVAAAPLSNSKVGKFAWLKCCESVCHELSYVTGVIWVTDLQVWKTGIPERERPEFFNAFNITSARGLWTSSFESSSPVLLH